MSVHHLVQWKRGIPGRRTVQGWTASTGCPCRILSTKIHLRDVRRDRLPLSILAAPSRTLGDISTAARDVQSLPPWGSSHGPVRLACARAHNRWKGLSPQLRLRTGKGRSDSRMAPLLCARSRRRLIKVASSLSPSTLSARSWADELLCCPTLDGSTGRPCVLPNSSPTEHRARVLAHLAWYPSHRSSRRPGALDCATPKHSGQVRLTSPTGKAIK
jgi:hypothetical protein